MSNAHNGIDREGTDRITKSVNNFSKRLKALVSETLFADLFPNLFNRIHLRSIWRNEKKLNIIRYLQAVRFMPACTVTH